MEAGNKNRTYLKELAKIKSLFPGLNKLSKYFQKEDIRLVGGCVRDLILNRPIYDVDLASVYKPNEIIDKFKSITDIKVIPTGIEHGTVTIVIDKHPFEVTTLRKDIECNGRQAKIEFTDKWEIDASRRDFTINALYMDFEGKLYDFFGGKEDLSNKKIKFIGDAEKRILEDHLRIMRYFRFMAQLEFTNYIEEEFLVCKRDVNYLRNISKERITNETLKLLSARKITSTMRLVKEANLFQVFGIENIRDILDINHLEEISFPYDVNKLTKLLYIFFSFEQINKFCCLSNKDKFYLKFLETTKINKLDDMKIIFYENGKELIRNLLIYLYLNDKQKKYLEYLNILDIWDETNLPKFPLTGKDCIELGIEPGPALKIILSEAKKYWILKDFLPNKEDLINLFVVNS